MAFSRPLYKKWHSRDHYTKNGIFETPIYKKMAYSRYPFTKKCIFERMGITFCDFYSPQYQKNTFLRPSYQKITPIPENGIF